MTCIIGYEYNGTTTIAGDSAAISSWMITQHHPKVFQLGEMVIGYAGSFRMGQLIQHCFEYPPLPTTGADERYFVREFVPALRKLFEDGGYGKKGGDSGDEGGTFMIGVQGKLFAIESDYQLVSTPTGILAIGVGREFAVGAMTALHSFVQNGKLSPQSAVERAMFATAQNCIGVSLPMTMLESHTPKVPPFGISALMGVDNLPEPAKE